MFALLALVAARLRGPECAPAPALTERNMCRAYDNKCAETAGFGAAGAGQLLQIPVVDASQPGFLTSREFIQRFVGSTPRNPTASPLLIKNASQFFLKHPELFTQEELRKSPVAHALIDTTSSGREVSNKERNKHSVDPLMPLGELFDGDERKVFFQAWPVDEGNGPAQEGLSQDTADHLDGPTAAERPRVAGDQSFSVSEYAWAHVKRDHGLFHHSGCFNFLMANEGGVLPHHHDAVLNILTQGAKRWTLVAPDAYESRAQRKHFENWKGTGLNTKYLSTQWYSDKSAQIKGLEHYDFVQEQGDAVFFPTGYTHATVDLCTPTIAFLQKGHFTESWDADADSDTYTD